MKITLRLSVITCVIDISELTKNRDRKYQTSTVLYKRGENIILLYENKEKSSPDLKAGCQQDLWNI